MQRRREAVLDHRLGIKILKRRVQLLKFIEVLEHRARHLINHGLRHVGAGHERCLDAPGRYVGSGGLVGTLGNGRPSVIGTVLGDHFFRQGAVEIGDLGATAVGRHGNAGVGHTNSVEEGVNLAVAQCLRLLRRGQFSGQFEILVLVPPGFLDQEVGGAALTRARVANANFLALEVAPALYIDAFTDDDLDRLGMNRKDGPELLDSLAFVLARAVVGVELPVGLSDAEFEIARHDVVDVVGRAASRRCGTADAVLATRLTAFGRRPVD